MQLNTDLFMVLADPSRRQIVDALRVGELAVNDIVDRLDIAQSGVSRHLRILADAGFVQARANGTRRLYSLRSQPFRELDGWIAQYRKLWDGRLDRLGAELARQQSNRAGTRKERTP